MSGAGRSTAAKVFEDLGWYVVDNLAPTLIAPMVDLVVRGSGGVERLAFVVDVRGRSFFDTLRSTLDELDTAGLNHRIVFLESADDVLVRRFEGVRRPHPLQGDGRIVDGIARERELLRELRGEADLVIDTSVRNVHELRSTLESAFGDPGEGELKATVMSFGFKYGLPVDADLVADVTSSPTRTGFPSCGRARAGPGSERLCARPARGQGIPGPLRGGLEHHHRGLPPRGQALSDAGHRLHRRQAPQRRHVRADRGAPVRRGCRHGGGPPRYGPRVTRPSVVALGGGHGLSATLAALRQVTDSLTAIVTVADNGGSSGRIRRELGGLPPGDLRMALAALCGDDEWGRTWADVLQHRFGGPADGELHGHAVGNLLIAALWERLGEPVAALDWVGRLLGARGRVLPMSTVPLEIEALVAGIDPARPRETGLVRGQHELAITPGRVLSVRLSPASPPAAPEAVAAVRAADWTVLGPGSWFTSVIPHLLVPELAEALADTPGKKLLTFNLAPQPGETDGFSAAQHLEVLADHCPRLRLDVVLADEVSCGSNRVYQPLEKAAAALGAQVWLAPLAAPYQQGDKSARHDPALLAAAFRSLFAVTA